MMEMEVKRWDGKWWWTIDKDALGTGHGHCFYFRRASEL